MATSGDQRPDEDRGHVPPGVHGLGMRYMSAAGLRHVELTAKVARGELVAEGSRVVAGIGVFVTAEPEGSRRPSNLPRLFGNGAASRVRAAGPGWRCSRRLVLGGFEMAPNTPRSRATRMDREARPPTARLIGLGRSHVSSYAYVTGWGRRPVKAVSDKFNAAFASAFYRWPNRIVGHTLTVVIQLPPSQLVRLRDGVYNTSGPYGSRWAGRSAAGRLGDDLQAPQPATASMTVTCWWRFVVLGSRYTTDARGRGCSSSALRSAARWAGTAAVQGTSLRRESFAT